MQKLLTKFKQLLQILGPLAIMLVLFAFGLKLATPETSNAAINTQLNYQGKITDSSGVAVSDGDYNMKFVIYDASSGGNCLWTSVGACDTASYGTTTVSTVNGIFSVSLGDTGQNSLATSSIDWNSNSLYLGVTVRGTTGSPVYDTEMSPRKRLTSSPYAFNSDTVDGLDATSTAAVANYLLALDSNGNLDLFGQGVSSTYATTTNLYVTGGTSLGSATSTGTFNIDGYASTTNLVLGPNGTNLAGFLDLYSSGGGLFFDATQLGLNNWQFSGTDAITPTTSVGLLVNASSTIIGNFKVDSSATTTASQYIGSQLNVATTSPWTGYEVAIAGDAVVSGGFYVDGSASTTSSFYTGSQLNVATTSPWTGYEVAIAGDAVIDGSFYVSGKSTSTTSLWIGSGGTANDIDLSGGDLYVQNDLEIDGTLYGATFLFGATNPSQAHSFISWSQGVANSNVDDASLYINPSSAVGDSNLIGAAVNGAVQFLVDAEGDIFANSITLSGSQTVGTSNISTLTVENNSFLGDAANTDWTHIKGSAWVNTNKNSGSASSTALSISQEGTGNYFDVFDNSSYFGGNTIFTINNVGSVGIGTSTPKYALTLSTTTVAGGTGLLQVATTTNQNIFIINNDGNVGIGTNAPADPLHVLTDSGGEAINIEEATGGEQWQIGVDASGNLDFQDSGSANTITFEDGGNVGIGTGDPFGIVHIVDTESTAYDGTNGNGQELLGATLAVQNADTTVESFSQILLRTRTSGVGDVRLVNINKGGLTSDFAITTEDGVSAYERFRITSTGLAGFNTSTPKSFLTVEGQNGTSKIFQVATTTNQDIFTVTHDGYVGIGDATPIAELEVSGSIVQTQKGQTSKKPSGWQGLFIEHASPLLGFFQTDVSDQNWTIQNSGGDLIFGTTTDAGLQNAAALFEFNTNRFAIATTTPLATVSIQTAGGNLYGGLNVYDYSDNDQVALDPNYGIIFNRSAGYIGNAAVGGDIYIRTSSASTAGYDKVAVNIDGSTGKVGIGIPASSSPGQELDVLGNASTSQALYAGTDLHVGYASASGNDVIYFDSDNENLTWSDSAGEFTLSDELLAGSDQQMQIGAWVTTPGSYAAIANSAVFDTGTSYALIQQSNGATYLNSASGTSVAIRVANSTTDIVFNGSTLTVDTGASIGAVSGGLNVGSLASGADDGEIVVGGADVGGYEIQAIGQAYVSDYLVALGGIHVGGSADPGTDNLIVDGTFTAGATGFAVDGSGNASTTGFLSIGTLLSTWTPSAGDLFVSNNATTTGVHNFGAGGAGDSIINFFDNDALAFVLGNDDSANSFVISDNTGFASGPLLTINSSGNVVLSGSISIEDVSYTWPSSQAGGSGYVLSNNGSGTLSWAAASGGSGTVNSGTIDRLAYYASTGTAVSEISDVYWASGFKNFGIATTSSDGLLNVQYINSGQLASLVDATSTYISTGRGLGNTGSLGAGGNGATVHISSGGTGYDLIGSQDGGDAGNVYLADGGDPDSGSYGADGTVYIGNPNGSQNATLDLNGTLNIAGSTIGNSSTDLSINASGGDVIIASGDRLSVGVGTAQTGYGLYVQNSGAPPAAFNRTTSDGVIVSLQQAGTEEGTISVSGTTVSYNAFTGSHYALTNQQSLSRGQLVSLTGDVTKKHDLDYAEPFYGIEVSTQENSSSILGSYLSLQTPNQPQGLSNPHLVMAVGNGDMWIVDNGSGNIKIGDYIITSAVAGHGQRDQKQYDISYVVARAAENVDWSDVSDQIGHQKHKRISVFFENFVIDNRVDKLVQMIDNLQGGLENFSLDNDSINLTVSTIVENGDFDLVMEQPVTFYGDIYVYGEANYYHKVTFHRDVQILGKLYVSDDQAGTATIPANSTSTEVIFEGEYQYVPKIIANLTSDEDNDIFVNWKTVNKKVSGFKIVIQEPVAQDLTFDWIALPVAEGEVTVDPTEALNPSDPNSAPPVILNLTSSHDTVGTGVAVELWAQVTDVDTPDEDLTYTWTMSPNLGKIEGDSGLVYWTIPSGTTISENTDVKINVSVTDGAHLKKQSITVTVLANDDSTQEEEDTTTEDDTTTEEPAPEEPVEEEPEVILGCMDNTALNYNENANQDSGLCEYAPEEEEPVEEPIDEPVEPPIEEPAEETTPPAPEEAPQETTPTSTPTNA